MQPLNFRRRPNPLMGLVAGLAMAVLVSGIALAVYVVRGPEVFGRLGVSVGGTIGLYVFGGIIGGLIVGLLFPLATWRWGAAILGALAGIPVYLGAGILLGDAHHVDGVIAGGVVGAIVGFGLWSPVQERATPHGE